MPELPEVETTRRGLDPFMSGQMIINVDLRRPNLRFPFEQDFCARLEGRRFGPLQRRAKYLIAPLDNGDSLVAHLGMSGSFRVEALAKDEAANSPNLYRKIPRTIAHDHVVIHLANQTRIIYNDPRRFGFMFVTPQRELRDHPRFRDIGLEPLEPPLTGAILKQALGGVGGDLKSALLNQKNIAGLGNIYVCEALFRAQLSPWRKAATLADESADVRKRADLLATSIKDVLQEAIIAGGSSLRDFSGADGKPGYFQHRFRVYDREGCPCVNQNCTGMIARAQQAGRSTFFCKTCQI